MGKQRKKKGLSPDQPGQAAASGMDPNSPHVPPLPQRIADQVSDGVHDEDERDDVDDDGDGDDGETSTSDGADENPVRPSGRPSAAEVAEEHRQSIANILKSLTGSTERTPNGDDLSAKLQRELMGQVINNYEIVNVVSSGGMGDVFGAVHTVMGRKAAIKVLRPEHCGDPALVQRFFNEARAANSIRHPNIVEVLDVGILPAGLPYITMELLEGETLAERLRRLGKMDIDQAVNFAVQASNALQAAHRQGIVHRDLKPDNLFIVPDPREAGRELIKILDFGIAKLHGDKLSKVKTNVGSILGTPPYMSPEQCRGIPDGVDHRSDVYALGVILFEMLCGAPPFVADGIGDVMVMHLSSPPPLPTWRRKEIPARIEQTILWALEKNPDQRIPSMADFAFALGVGPTPVPYLATPTGLMAPSFPPAPHSGSMLGPHSPAPIATRRGSTPPPAVDMDPTLADDRAPETAPPHDLAVTQYSSVHPPAVAVPSIPPALVEEEVPGGRRWLASIAWASAAGLLIAASGWYFTNRDDAPKDDRVPRESSQRSDVVDRAQRAHAVEPSAHPARTVAVPTLAEQEDTPPSPEANEQLETAVNSAAGSNSALTADTSGVDPKGVETLPNNQTLGPNKTLEVKQTAAPTRATRPPSASPGRGGAAQAIRGPWVPTKSVAEIREALEAQAAAEAQPNSQSPNTLVETPAPVQGPAVNSDAPGAAPEAPVQPKPQAAATGILNLAAAPWASVSLNGRLLGVTPLLNVRLPVGVHQLNLSNPELGKSTVVVVEISADKPVSRFVGWHKTP